MQLSVRSVLATGVSLSLSVGIVAAAPLADPLPAARSAPVALAGAWQDLADHTHANLAKLSDLVTHYPPLPILSQLASNQATYARWLAGQDGGNPAMVAQTVVDHVVAVAAAAVRFSILMPLSLAGAFVSPAVTAAYLVQATGKYPSTPQTWLQAFLDAPAVYLDTTLNCCSTPLFDAAFGLLSPGPVGLVLSLPISIAEALSIAPPPTVPQSAARGSEPASTPAAGPATQPNRSSARVQSRRPQSAAALAPARGTKRTATVSKAVASNAQQTAPRSKARSATARAVRPGSQGTR
ncbi:hypothetical protein B1R94_26630 [Mycolicibacterium litorale]|nr:hypothetical protein B1R94_26630 [Mycolicibacterium litorale]